MVYLQQYAATSQWAMYDKVQDNFFAINWAELYI